MEERVARWGFPLNEYANATLQIGASKCLVGASEGDMDVRCRRVVAARESSPDRAKVCAQMQPRVRPVKKVQVVYYLSRNGHLEHPHYMEVAHFSDQSIRLKDVMDRLTVLRGKGMPSLYSWSCKRSYKSGYVWNDLSENDIIHPAEGAEYVLKGSELVEGCSEKIHQAYTIKETNQLHSKRKPSMAPSPHRESTEEQEYEDYDEEEEYELEDGEKSSSTTPHSRCSRGVSTEELGDRENPAQTQTTPDDSALSSLLSSEKRNQNDNKSSKRFTGNSNRVAVESVSSRNSVLLQLIACGSSTVAKAKNPGIMKEAEKTRVRKSESFHRTVLSKSAAKVVEEDMINYISENPRFGNLQSVEKEYFSGSIVESMSVDRVVDGPGIKKSNSYNEERSEKAGLGEVEEKREEKAVKGRCIPLMKSSSATSKAGNK